MFRIPSQVGFSFSINLQFNCVPWEWRCTTEIFWYRRRCHWEQRSVMSETSSSTCCCRLIKMQYTEQDVCGQVTGRFLASRKEGQTKAGRRDNLVWRDEVRRRVDWRTRHLSSDDRTQETLHYTSNCIPRADKSLRLTPAWYPNNSIEHLAREVSLKSVHGWHFSPVFGPNQAL